MGVGQYLLDTNICIFYLMGKYDIELDILLVGLENCALSEITVAELKFGVANSQKVTDNTEKLNQFLSLFTILPIFPVLDIWANEKVRLRRAGKMVDDFDLLIGSTAVYHERIMVTQNVKHFENIEGIVIENWAKR